MSILNDRMYTKSHEWVQFLEDNKARIGLTDYAQDSLGGLVFVNLPEEGDDVTKEVSFGDVESVKAVSDIFSPVSGTVCAINEELMDSPERINDDPYGVWLIEVKNISEKTELLSADEYEKYLKEEA